MHRDGVHCHGLRYLDLTLAAYVGESVEIRYDPRDLAEIRIYYQGRYLCRAVAPELAAATISLKDLQTARTSRRRELRTQLRDRRSLANAVTANTREAIPPAAPLTARPTGPTEPPPAARPRLRLYLED